MFFPLENGGVRYYFNYKPLLMPVYALHNFDCVIVIMSIVIIMNQCYHFLIPIASHTTKSLCHFQRIV